MPDHTTAKQAFDSIQSGMRLFVHGGVATPNTLLKGLVAHADRLQNVELIHLHTHGPALYARPEFKNSFRTVNLFVGANMRPLIDHDHVDYLPVFLSEMPRLFRKKIRPVDVALIHVSPPDQHGYVSLGTSIDAARAAVDTAKIVIAQINPQMPRTHGDGLISMQQIHHWIEVDEPLPEVPRPQLSEVETKIGALCAELIPDGATLQMGIGSIPDAVLSALKNHKNLGIHTEMWSDGALDLLNKGIVNNSLKKVHSGKTVATFVMGTRAVYDFVHDNPASIFLDAEYVNTPGIIGRNPKVTAINSAIEIDLTGQVCADSIGTSIFSGVGGQMDFLRGAALSEGGRPILALPSTTHKKQTRIVPTLKPGAGVVTTRAHVHTIVTEYGVAELYGKTLGERARALIKIAHPDHREDLERAWVERLKK